MKDGARKFAPLSFVGVVWFVLLLPFIDVLALVPPTEGLTDAWLAFEVGVRDGLVKSGSLIKLSG